MSPIALRIVASAPGVAGLLKGVAQNTQDVGAAAKCGANDTHWLRAATREA